MSTLTLPAPPRTEGEWVRSVEQRLRQIESSKTTRVGEWTFQDIGGDLLAVKPGDSFTLGDAAEPTSVNLGNLRGFTEADKAEVIDEAKKSSWEELYERLSGSTGPVDALDALSDFLTGQFTSPIDALRIFGQLLPGQIPTIPISSIGGAFEPELLSDPKFNGEISMEGQGIWDWVADDGHETDGCAHTTADGTEHELQSNYIIVTEGQKIKGSVWTKWAGLVSTGNPIRLEYALYKQGVARGTIQLDEIVAPASSSGWTKLSGDTEIPADVDSVRLRLVVANTATAGDIYFDDGSASLFGLLPQFLVDGLTGVIDFFKELFDAVGGVVGTITDDIVSRFQNINLTGLFDASALTNLANSVIQTIKDTIGGTLGATWTDIQARLSGLANDGKLFVEKILGSLPFGQVTSPVGGLSLGEDFGEIIDGFWNTIFGRSDTGRDTADFAAATQALKQKADDAYAAAIYAFDVVNQPRLTPRWMSTGINDDVSFPIINAQSTFVPASGKLVFIPITPNVDRTYKTVKFATTSNGMTQCYVGVYRVNASLQIEKDIDLGNVKSLLASTSRVQALSLPGAGMEVAKGETVFIGVLQVGNPRGVYTTPGLQTVLEVVQNIPLFFSQDGGSGYSALPTLVGGHVELAPVWGALGESTNLAAQWTEYSSVGTNLPLQTYNIPTDSTILYLAGCGGGGGGGGGDGGWGKPGEGGGPGQWNTLRLERGVDISGAVTTLTVQSERTGSPTGIGGNPGNKESNGTVGHDIVFRNGADNSEILRCVGGRFGRLAYGGFYNRDSVGYGAGDLGFAARLFKGGGNTTSRSGGGGAGDPGTAPGGGGGGGAGGTVGRAAAGGWGAAGYAAIKAT